jgi:hypothetical protein
MLKKKIALILMAISFVGCASYFKKKTCESTNWYTYGQDLAMKGMRPGDDTFVQECKKVGADIAESQLDVGFKSGMTSYCKPETAFQKGKSAESFNPDLCDPSKEKSLMKSHADGVIAYCQKDNGYSVGSSGKVYGGICPPNLEKEFKKEYSRGRKKYLEQAIISQQQTIEDLNSKITNKSVELSMASVRLGSLRQPRQVQRLVGNQVVTETEDPDLSLRNSYRYDVDRLQQELHQLQDQQSTARTQANQYRQELGTIE